MIDEIVRKWSGHLSGCCREGRITQTVRAILHAMQFHEFPDITSYRNGADGLLYLYFSKCQTCWVMIDYGGKIFLNNGLCHNIHRGHGKHCDYRTLKTLLIRFLQR